jgi:hypothetical protein
MFNLERIIEKLILDGADGNLYNLEGWIASEIAMRALEMKQTIYNREKSGFLNGDKEEFINKINDNLVKIYDCGKNKNVFISDSSLLIVEHEGEENYSFSLLSLNEKEILNFVEIAGQHLTKNKKNTVSVLTSGMDGFYLTPIGTLDAPFARDNYTQEVVDGFDFAVSDLKSPDPFGRLTVINGPPGTGKTYLIRGIINELDNNTVVLIPPKLISEIDGPSLLPTFIGHRRKNKRSIVIIIEDADACLAPRMNDNISSISSLLNHTDGILGTLLDIKIIASTNQENMEFDDALTRAGRLSRHIEVDPLSADKAQEVYKRLTDQEIKYNKPTILADVYADVKSNVGYKSKLEKDDNFDPDPGKKLRKTLRRRVGFGR